MLPLHLLLKYIVGCITESTYFFSVATIVPFVKTFARDIWTASSEFGTYRLSEQRRFRRACASAQSRQNLRCSLIQAVSQEEPSDRKLDPWLLWMTGHAQLKFVMTECSKTQIRLTGPNYDTHKWILSSLSRLMTKPTKWLCAQRRLSIHPVWSKSSLCVQWVDKDPSFLHADNEDWSDWAGAQADLSLRWAHMPFCRFSHEAAHLFNSWTLELGAYLHCRMSRGQNVLFD